MRRDGRATTRAEIAFKFAREAGAREDAIQAAWERNRDRESELSELDWVNAVNVETQRLNAAGIPRPEVVQDYQRKVVREKQKRGRQPRIETAPPPAAKVKIA